VGISEAELWDEKFTANSNQELSRTLAFEKPATTPTFRASEFNSVHRCQD
jgi:hypothetical protein